MSELSMLGSLKPLIISAPFGNWFNREYVTSTLGTFTRKYRGGLLYRGWRMLRTLRYSWRMKSWLNKLGLPNPGIDSLPPTPEQQSWGAYPDKPDYSNKIISVVGFNRNEWYELATILVDRHQPMAVELNVSCPNAAKSPEPLNDVAAAIGVLQAAKIPIIVKIPPIRWMDIVRPLYDMGVRAFHCCNTIPTPGGGLSGKVQKQYALWCVEEVRLTYGENIFIIGGGGIDSVSDVREYDAAGADHVAVASTLLNPFRWNTLPLLDQAAAAMTRKSKL